MRNIKIEIEYDGTNYYGWQRQPIGNTIEQAIEKAIEKATGEYSEVFGSSRTDAGVHAKGYVANFKTNSTIPGEKFMNALNVKLPKDIVIIKSEEVNENFHARYSSTGKTYCYTVFNRVQPPALERNYVYHFRHSLNIDKMREACKYFIGTHDFRAFRTPGSSVKTSVRTITDLHIKKIDHKINIYISGDGFLYNMVRIIVGTLLRIGREKMEPSEVKDILLSHDRLKAGKCVPASGLCLEKVFY